MLIVFSLSDWDVFPHHQDILGIKLLINRNHCRQQPPTQARCRRRRTWWSSLFPSSPSPPLLGLALPAPAGMYSPLLSAWWFTTGIPIFLILNKVRSSNVNFFLKMWLVKMWLSGKGSTCRPAVWSLTRRARPRERLIMSFPLKRCVSFWNWILI